MTAAPLAGEMGKRVEVLSGLKAGMPYASTGSFVVKSELGKGSAEHTH